MSRKSLALIILLAVFMSACECEKSIPTRYIWFVDQSASVPPQPHWRVSVERQSKKLTCGDKVIVYGVNDVTTTAKPLFDNGEVPDVSCDPTFEEERKCRLRLNQVRQELLQQFDTAVLNHQANQSDYLGAIDRIQTDPRRHTVVVFAGDMVQSSGELDLETFKLSDDNLAETLQRIFAKHRWQQGQLQGVTIYCVLSSVESGAKPSLNDRRELSRFWRALFENLGARVELFDTQFDNF